TRAVCGGSEYWRTIRVPEAHWRGAQTRWLSACGQGRGRSRAGSSWLLVRHGQGVVRVGAPRPALITSPPSLASSENSWPAIGSAFPVKTGGSVPLRHLRHP